MKPDAIQTELFKHKKNTKVPTVWKTRASRTMQDNFLIAYKYSVH